MLFINYDSILQHNCFETDAIIVIYTKRFIILLYLFSYLSVILKFKMIMNPLTHNLRNDYLI